MQPNKTKLALQIGAVVLGATSASNALADTFTLTVNTIQDVTIAEVTPMAFGTNILTTASATCTMQGSQPAPATVNSDGTWTTGTGSDVYGLLNGAACIGDGVTTATPGVYSITGEPTLDVAITLSTEAQVGNFTFSPDSGCAVDYDNATASGSGDELCSALTVGTPSTITLPGATDTAATAGEALFTTGGTISIQAGGLTSDTDYNATFLVNVVY